MARVPWRSRSRMVGVSRGRGRGRRRRRRPDGGCVRRRRGAICGSAPSTQDSTCTPGPALPPRRDVDRDAAVSVWTGLGWCAGVGWDRLGFVERAVFRQPVPVDRVLDPIASGERVDHRRVQCLDRRVVGVLGAERHRARSIPRAVLPVCGDHQRRSRPVVRPTGSWRLHHGGSALCRIVVPEVGLAVSRFAVIRLFV